MNLPILISTATLYLMGNLTVMESTPEIPSCVDAQCDSQLQLPDLWFKRPMTQADEAFFRFLQAISSSGEVRIYSKPYHWFSFTKYVQWLKPGSILVINGNKKKLMEYFKNHGWELFPFYWRDHLIYRKPLMRSA